MLIKQELRVDVCMFDGLFVQVNGNDVRRASHQEAVNFLIAPVPDVYLTVRHDPPPAGLQVCS